MCFCHIHWANLQKVACFNYVDLLRAVSEQSMEIGTALSGEELGSPITYTDYPTLGQYSIYVCRHDVKMSQFGVEFEMLRYLSSMPAIFCKWVPMC